MKNPNKDLSEEFKREADQSIFHKIDFSEEMKDKVRAEVNSNIRSKGIPILNWRRYTVIAAVALVSLVTISTLFLADKEGDLAEQHLNELGTFSSEDEVSNFIDDPYEIKTWDMKSKDDLKQLFTDMLLPTYTADTFQQEGITLQGINKEDANKVLFTYLHDDRSYMVIIEKNEQQLKPVDFERVDINGMDGYLNTEGNEKELTELHFYSEKYHYMINGMVSAEDAIKIARSFQ